MYHRYFLYFLVQKLKYDFHEQLFHLYFWLFPLHHFIVQIQILLAIEIEIITGFEIEQYLCSLLYFCSFYQKQNHPKIQFIHNRAT